MGGEFVQMAAACARHTRAHMIVVSPALQRAGHQAIALARASGAQVLIARGEDGNSPILAATDLQDPAFPVLRSAAEVARRLKQPMIAFHNVDPLSVMSGRAVTSTGVMLSGGVPKATRRESLVSVSRSLRIDPNPVLRTELDPAHAILEEAEACDASLIVVGARSCSWWRRLTSEHVSVRVASESERAVLVTPIP
jgi:nucleotide-binding universal stress UspA family protein